MLLQNFRSNAPGHWLRGAAAAVLSLLFAGCASVSTAPGADSTDAASIARSVPAAPSSTAAPAQSAKGARPGALAKEASQRPADGDESATPSETNLWNRVRAGFALPELDTPLVAEKERFYLSKPDYLQRMFQRSGRYLYYIVEEIEKRGMPTELALLPFVESAMNPVALSSAQAAGLWQFIPSTGKAYDLNQNWWVDNRRDVVKSTQAALDYLQKIYAMNGDDWFLALASYNWGEGAVARAVKKNQARGRPTDYLHLDMPAETRNYVPKLLALKNILLRADALGIALPEVPNRPYFVTVEKTRPIDLKLAAQFAGMNVDEFVALNPAHNRPVIAASKNNEIKLPADRVDDFLEAVDKHEEAKKIFASWQPYTLKSGETLETVAHRSGVAPAELRKANGLHEQQRIIAGTRILAPHKVVEDESRVEQFVAPRVYEQVDRPAQYHTVGRKESLQSIARKYGISTATLAAWNGNKKGVRRGMRLLVQPAATQTLLTREDGDRSVVSTVPDAGFMKAVLRTETESATSDNERRSAKSGASRAGTKAAAPSKTSRSASRSRSKSRPTQQAETPARKQAERRLPDKTTLYVESSDLDRSA
jgi:membrane-bound lytic murein transglycosylase D